MSKVDTKVDLYGIDTETRAPYCYIMPSRREQLPPSLTPRGLSRVQAATYIGVAPTLFDEMVEDGRMPKPVRINARVVWDRYRLDDAFSALSDYEVHGDPWSKVAL